MMLHWHVADDQVRRVGWRYGNRVGIERIVRFEPEEQPIADVNVDGAIARAIEAVTPVMAQPSDEAWIFLHRYPPHAVT
jgi:hypothetical protein